MLPHLSLYALSFIIYVATSYTVLILVEYVKQYKTAVKRRSAVMGVIALGSGYIAIHFIGILTFMADYRFMPKLWMIGLSWIASCLTATVILRALSKGIHSRREMAQAVAMTAVLGKLAHFLSIGGILEISLRSISVTYYALFAATIVAVCYVGFRFVLQRAAEISSEGKRIRNALIMGAVLALLHYISAGVFYSNMAVAETQGGWMLNIAIVAAVIVTVLLISAANMVFVDLQAMNTEAGLLRQVKESESRFRSLAYTDQLTGLPNRHWFFGNLRELLETADGHLRSVGIMLLDFNDFKSLNDLLGHDGADLFLKKMAGRLEAILPETVQLARLGGDEFIYVVPNASRAYLEQLCQDIVSVIREPLQIGGRRVASGISIGVSNQDMADVHEESLIKQADLALFMAKSRGKDSYEFFSPELLDGSIRKQEIASALQQALLNGEFAVHYQPQVELSSGRIIGFEALLRWNSTLGAVSPAEFIPVAEECGAIDAIGEWVLREACLQLNSWRRQGKPDVHISINVSPQQLRDLSFARKVAKILEETDVPANCVEIEITESVMLDLDTASGLLQELKKIGVKLAIDDFGTGYSSLNAVKNIQIDTLKIDKSLVDEVQESDRSMAILTTIIELGRNLGAGVVVEGLETIEQVDLMKQHGIIGQGYYFSRPLPAGKATKVWEKYLEQPNGLFRAPILY